MNAIFFTFTCAWVFALGFPITEKHDGKALMTKRAVLDNSIAATGILRSEKFAEDTEELWTYDYPPFNKKNSKNSIESKSLPQKTWNPPEKMPNYVMGVLEPEEVDTMLRELVSRSPTNNRTGKSVVLQDGDTWIWKN